MCINDCHLSPVKFLSEEGIFDSDLVDGNFLHVL